MPDTWRPLHSRRQILELQAAWSRSCRKQGPKPTPQLWSLVVESGYCRALSEEEGPDDNGFTLQQKIHFWRANIPEAAGSPEVANLLEAQRELQIAEEVRQLEGGSVLYGDLVAWRQADLLEWMDYHPAEAQPTLV